ncbi:1-acyl-sn-glycerol-3-phosphate acyltransferase [Plantactinospora sp. KBS50]|uniref:lysophospholipid acyltransferase family protein n=1 Tax=Plantactinospora sp. KBS50 TaxID=2024580 RepID=UPI000BAB028F|nr:lysophospholipid acyltransferase family protein [Plantactinospora sp. KBS50]ASW56553.1 hypothetical protein CIK06_23935 [Plantactinospora sp. KBS50]
MTGAAAGDRFWHPRADCGPGCLPAEPAGRVGRPRRCLRLAGLFGVLLLGLGLLPALWLLRAGRAPADRVRPRRVPPDGAVGRVPPGGRVGRAWARAVLRVLGVRLTVTGAGRLPTRRALLVANHTSWLDIVAVLAVAPTRMVAKAEVRRWPLFGQLAAVAGTVFIDRSRPRALPGTVREVATALRSGGLVTVFPEGTTWCGTPRAGRCDGSGRFRPALFQAALDAGAAVVPLTIGYAAAAGSTATTAAAFLGQESLYASLRRVLAVPDLVISITVAPALHPAPGADRRNLARVAGSASGFRPAPARTRVPVPTG